jgi:hypothetical protein
VFHFRKSRHRDRVAYLEALKWAPFKVISVVTHKPSLLADSSLSTEKLALFRYTMKLLVERISWYSDETPSQRTPRRAKLIFAERGQIDLDRIKGTFAKLRRDGGNHSIRWHALDLEETEAVPAGKHTGLQVADAAASSVGEALELTFHSMTEHRYVKMWRDKYYRRNGQCDRYGLKAFPHWPPNDPTGRQHWLHHFK